ncbi:MAG TPA: hypothetical protein VN703_03960, partial [Candidatus Sulfopaludibacter sp.]|nr:hypothetical protein [Candidatus Sulfopaludibacter sp.]
DVSGFSIDFKKIISRVNEITDSESNEIKKNLLKREIQSSLQKNVDLLEKRKLHFTKKMAILMMEMRKIML